MATIPFTTATPSGTQRSNATSSNGPSPRCFTASRQASSLIFQSQLRSTACWGEGVPQIASSSTPSQRFVSCDCTFARTQPML